MRSFTPFASGPSGLILGAWTVLVITVWWLQPVAIIPSPIEVAVSFYHLFVPGGTAPVILPDLMASMRLNIEAICISTTISLAAAYSVTIPALRPVSQVLSKMRYLGLTGLTFLIGLLVGGGHGLKLALLVFGMATFYTTSMAAAVEDIPLDTIRHARALRMGPWRAWFEVVVLGTFDTALETLRQNAAIGLIMLTTVEILAQSEGGIGVALRNVNRSFRMEDVFALQFLVLLIGLGQDYFFSWLKGIACPYTQDR